ncbi:hypothetical protein FB45DRAFT_139044 [Roridomyces roridus]|uniref:Ricin B lectin domain-containing protein n=1 Tax=Roridomyces roridus TaxID=1738132 RepID=A0AAD7BI03_9AGAR|nr:hypothetical protein FB45DRAFT_139044 [Roridomyces roridus]
MLSTASIVASLLPAHSVLANPVARASCNPSIAGQGISLGSGAFEVGYTGSVAGAAIVTEALTTSAEYIVATSNGGLQFIDFNESGASSQLYQTNSDGAVSLQTLVTPENGTQDWSLVCSICNDPSTVGSGGAIATGCNVISSASGKCLQIGSAVGAAVTVETCTDLGDGAQVFVVTWAHGPTRLSRST